MLKHADIADVIVRGFHEVYNDLGPGSPEPVYAEALCSVLRKLGLDAAHRQGVVVSHGGVPAGRSPTVLIVNNTVFVEVRAVRHITPDFDAQVTRHLTAARMEVALLLNFGPKPEFRRFANGGRAQGLRSPLIPSSTSGSSSSPSSLLLFPLRQRFPDPRLPDVAGATRASLAACGVRLAPGARIAVGVGSRGIADYCAIVKTVVAWVKQQGAQPFLVPAMGSHGGATAEGQLEVLASYGITEANTGAPVVSSMEVVELPARGLETKLFMDRNAFESDGVILVNRIKPHTDFHGAYESGLAKMSVIGLGKQAMASETHSLGVHGLRDLMPQAARVILSSGKILLGVAMVENAYDRTMAIRAIPATAIMDQESGLLDMARAHMPALPVPDIDVLIVDRIGKDISGVGMDPNIIGRMMIRGEVEPESPRIKAIMATDVTHASHGNALGMGFADVMTRRLFDKIDYDITYTNVYTATFLERAKIPIIAETDARALDFALRSCGRIAPGQERIVRIRDTLHLGEVWVSQAVAEELRRRNDAEARGHVDAAREGEEKMGEAGAEIVGGPEEMLTAEGQLRDVWPS